MSTEQGRVASLILQEAFGEVVEKVGSFLIKTGRCALLNILKGTCLEKIQVKKSVCILIQHKLVTHEVQKKHSTIYKIDLDSILQRVRFPRWIYVAKVLYGDVGEFIVEDLLQQGHTPMSQCIERVTNRLKELAQKDKNIEEIVQHQFKLLVEGRFVQRSSSLAPELVGKAIKDVSKDKSTTTTTTTSSSKDGTNDSRFLLPPSMDAMIGESNKRKRKGSVEVDGEPGSKKRKKESVNRKEQQIPDAGIVWEVNHDKFQQYSRDQVELT